MSKKSTSKNAKLAYQRYRDDDKRKTNKLRKLTKYVLKNPNDKQAEQALNAL